MLAAARIRAVLPECLVPKITAVYAAVLALLVVILALRVALYRLRNRIGAGDGGDARLLRRIRAHGNAAEFVPLGLILLALLELCGAAAWGLHVAGASFVLARVAHAVGLARSTGSSIGRAGGAVLTFVVLIGMALWLLWLAVPR